MLSLSGECRKMLQRMIDGPPYYGRVGAMSIIAENAFRREWAATRTRLRKAGKPRTAHPAGTSVPDGPPTQTQS